MSGRRSPQALVNLRAEILKAVSSVLCRPEFGCSVRFGDNDILHITRGDFQYRALVHFGYKDVTLNVYTETNGEPDMLASTFFHEKFMISKMGKVRQKALILAKKIQHREIYEVMTM